MAARLRWQLGGQVARWDDVRIERSRIRRQAVRAAWRWPGILIRPVLLIYAAVPVAYFVIGGTMRWAEIQDWLARRPIVVLAPVIASAAVTLVLVAWLIVRWAELPGSVGDLKGRLVLALQCQAATLAGTVLLLARFQTGGSLTTSVIPATGAHAVDALALMILVTGLIALTLAAGLVAMPAGAVLLGVSVGELAFGGAVMSASGVALYGASQSGVAFGAPFGGSDPLVGDGLSAAVAVLAEIPSMVMNEGRAIGGEWDDGPKPPSPLDAELDEIVEHAWEKHVVDANEFPEISTPDELKELLEEVIEQSAEWGYREDGSVYWYDEVTDTIVIKNPPGIGGSTYRPRAKDHFDG